MYDDPIQRALREQMARSEQANRDAVAMASQLVSFRATLILGGFSEQDAVDMAGDYFDFLTGIPIGDGDDDE